MPAAIRLALVGYGHRGAYMFGLAVKGFEGITPVGICDNNPALLEKAKADFPGVAVFTDFDTMLAQVAPDALLVETPATLHAEFCSKALGRNVHVMSDVPCVERVEEADLLWQAQLRSRAFYMIGANPNLWGFVEGAVDLRKQGVLGEPYYLEAEYIHDVRYLFAQTPWRATYPPIKYCTHSLGPLLRLVDEDLEWVSCFDTGSHVNRAPGQHDAMAALFRTRTNVVVRLLCSFINNCPVEGHRYRVYGTKGYFERTTGYDGRGTARTLFYSTEKGTPKAFTELPVQEMLPEYAGNPQAAGHGGADYALLDRFFQAIRGNQPSPIDLRQALRMTLPGLYAAESARRGGELLRIRYPWSADGAVR